jgi:hypothetical protein
VALAVVGALRGPNNARRSLGTATLFGLMPRKASRLTMSWQDRRCLDVWTMSMMWERRSLVLAMT